VKFHHGAPFTADDVIFSLDRTLNDKSPAFDRLGRSVLIAAVWPMVGYRKDRRLQGRAADQWQSTR
jgi:ABC-type transport system substrate-binding protein